MTSAPPASSHRTVLDANVDVIVVTFNSRANFARLKAALERQTIPFRLIVVDNASAIEQRPTPRDLPEGAVILQMTENLGFARGNNHAAALCNGAFIALLNPDAFPEPDWLERLVDAAERWPSAACFGSTQISDENQDRLDGLGDCYSFSGIPWRGGYGWPTKTTPIIEGETFSPCAAAALYRTDAWRAVGGFDESFFCYCEDVDLGFRLRLAGFTCMQIDKAVVRHIGGASSGARSFFSVFHGTRNRLWTFVKNMPAPLIWIAAPAHILVTVAFLLMSLFRGTAAATWSGVFAGIRGLPAVLKARSRVQAQRAVQIADLARVLSWVPSEMASRAPVIRSPAITPQRDESQRLPAHTR